MKRLPLRADLVPWLLIVMGLLCAAVYLLLPVTVTAGGETIRLRGFYFLSGDALHGAGIRLGHADRLDPSANAWIRADGRVTLERASVVSLWVDGQVISFETLERIPANWLARAGIDLFPGDRVLVGGREVDPLLPLSGSGPFAVQYLPRRPLRLTVDGEILPLYSAGRTLGEALWENGLFPHKGDRVSQPLDALLTGLGEVELHRARALIVLTAQGETILHTAAPTVGEALHEAGMAPQGLDYTQPAVGQPIPPDGRIRLVRVRETVAVAQALLPYASSYAPSAELELEQRAVVQPGRYGMILNRERVRSEDGIETVRERDEPWTAAEAQDEVVGVGTQAVVRTLETEVGTLEYYRAVLVYATSYSPCQQGLGRCTLATASGIPLAKGVVAVRGSWFRLFAGVRVYIPGYGIGVIGDVGGGIPGTYWIDLGYSEDDYQPWHHNVTLYFLTPVPANVPAILP